MFPMQSMKHLKELKTHISPKQKENKIMKENYYALLVAIFTERTVSESLGCMGIVTSEEEE